MDVFDVAMMLIRLAVGIVMIAHGANHWLGGEGIAGTARWFSGLGLRNGVLQARLSVITEIGAGILVVVGLLTPLACAAVIAVMLVAGLLAHRLNGFFVFREGYEYVLVLATLALALALLGPGAISIDGAAGFDFYGWVGGGVALGLGVASTAAQLSFFWRPNPKVTV